jgi:ferric-dicitrate binding protein FerR (iron transport regulator)
MSDTRLQALFNRYVHTADLSPAEEEELMALLAEQANKNQVQQLIDQLVVHRGEEAVMEPAAAEAIMEAILQADRASAPAIAPIRPIRHQFIRRFAAAAVLLLMAAGIYWWSARDTAAVSPFAFTVPDNIKPGGDKAVLTLADGTQVVLDTVQNGVLQSAGAITIRKTKDGQLVYEVTAVTGDVPAAENYNTISTPNGGQYQVLLPDGSKVWLNAASSIRFPIAFTGKERKVTITGEAYFEIAASANRPFMVQANETTVQVLGTHFNMNSYTDERYLKTTLLEGSVKVVTGNSNVLLQPGQQAVSAIGGPVKAIDRADLEEAVAWKNGMFHMSEMPIPAMMRQVSRWYNVEVVYPNGVPAGTITGKFPRSMNFSSVLQVLLKSGVSLRMEGQKIVVNP